MADRQTLHDAMALQRKIRVYRRIREGTPDVLNLFPPTHSIYEQSHQLELALLEAEKELVVRLREYIPGWRWVG